MITQIFKDGQKNLSVLVKGIVNAAFKPTVILDLGERTSPSQGWKGVRLDSVVWVVQEKMLLHLWWDQAMTEQTLILPMESRNSLRLEDGVPSPRIDDGWKGKIWLSADNVSFQRMSFCFILDLDKQ